MLCLHPLAVSAFIPEAVATRRVSQTGLFAKDSSGCWGNTIVACYLAPYTRTPTLAGYCVSGRIRISDLM